MKFHSSILVFITLIFNVACSEPMEPAKKNNDGPQRIVVISPAAAEILDRLGLNNRVVGRGQFGPWPNVVAQQPVVGGYDSPNVEQTIKLEAEIVLNTKSQAAVTAHRRLNKVGVEVMELNTSKVEGIFETLERIGDRFNRRKQADKIKQEILQEIETIKEIARNLPKRRVLFVVGRDPVYVAGPGSHLDYMINLVGGDNIAKDSIAPYQQISMETILERQPEVIIDVSFNHESAFRGRQAGTWDKWQLIPAVKNNEIHWIDPSQMSIPSIRLGKMSYLMGKLIHPEIFGPPSEKEYFKFEYVNYAP